MALNPKLNIYVVSLNPRDKEASPTYRDYFKSKYFGNEVTPDKKLLERFLKDFLNTVGTADFRRDDKNKKVIGVSEYNEQNKETSIKLLMEKHVIHGFIDGGQYGVKRAYANMNNKNDKKDLNVDQVVLDKFYLCLCTPLNSAYGFLFIQSYTEASIQEPVFNFIRDLLYYEDEYFNVSIEPYVPKKFVEKFKEGSKIRMFSYRSRIGISDVMRDNKLAIKGQAFDVEVLIKPIEEDFSVGDDNTQIIADKLGEKKIDGIALSDYNTRKIFVKGSNGRNANYDVDKDIKSLRPTIYLQDEGISIDEDTGQPDFEEIKQYVLNLLEEVKKEYNGYENIEEL